MTFLDIFDNMEIVQNKFRRNDNMGRQNTYANPFILERADPFMIKADDGWYYFTASYPMKRGDDPEGYDRVILRRSRRWMDFVRQRRLQSGRRTKRPIHIVLSGHRSCITSVERGTFFMREAVIRKTIGHLTAMCWCVTAGILIPEIGQKKGSSRKQKEIIFLLPVFLWT